MIPTHTRVINGVEIEWYIKDNEMVYVLPKEEWLAKLSPRAQAPKPPKPKPPRKPPKPGKPY